MADLYRVDSPINREQRNNLNETFKDIQVQIGNTFLNVNKVKDEVGGLQEQIDVLVVEGDSSPEAAQARVGYDGEVYPTLKNRIDNEVENVYQDIDEVTLNLNKAIKPDGVKDDAPELNLIFNSGIKEFTGSDRVYNILSQLNIPEGLRIRSIKLDVNYTPSVSGSSAIVVSGDNVEIDNFYINTNNKEFIALEVQNVKNVIIKNGKIENGGYNGLTLSGSENCEVSKVEFVNCVTGSYQGGVLQIEENSKNTVVDSCTIKSSEGKGISLLESDNTTIKNCYVENCKFENFYPGRGAKRVLFYKCNSIKNNVSSYNNSSGVKCSRGSEYITFEQCYMEQGGGTSVISPLYIQGSSNVIVDNCNLKSSSDQVILASWHPADGSLPATPANNLTIKDSTLDANDIGICFRANPSFTFDQMENITLEGCSLINFTAAVVVKNIKKMRILDNDVKCKPTSTRIIVIEGDAGGFSDDTVISNCRIENARVSAIRLYYTKNFKASDNIIVGNLNTINAVDSEFSSKIKFLNCTIEGFFNVGMYIRSTNTFVTVNDCVLDGNGSGIGLNIEATQNVIVDGNNFNVTTPLRSTTQNINTVLSGNSYKKVTYYSSAPTSGTWSVGDKVYILSPTASTTEGWVCTAAGTPGTWKSFGTIIS